MRLIEFGSHKATDSPSAATRAMPFCGHGAKYQALWRAVYHAGDKTSIMGGPTTRLASPQRR